METANGSNDDAIRSNLKLLNESKDHKDYADMLQQKAIKSKD